MCTFSMAAVVLAASFAIPRCDPTIPIMGQWDSSLLHTKVYSTPVV